MFIPLISATTAPAIFSAAVLFSIWHYIKYQNKKSLLISVSFIVITAILFFLFYKLTGSSLGHRISQEESLIDIVSRIKTLWKAIIQQITLITLKAILFAAIPVLLVLPFRKKIPKNYWDAIIFSLLTIFMGVTIFQLIFDIPNAYQLPYIGTVALTSIVTIGIVLVYNRLGTFKKSIVFLVFLVVGLLTTYQRGEKIYDYTSIEYNHLLKRGYNHETIIQLRKHLITNEPDIIEAGCLTAGNETKGLNLTKPKVFQLGGDFYILRNKFNLYPITPNNFNERPELLYLKEQLPFYRNFDEENPLRYTNQYIRENNLQFVISDVQIEGLEVPVIVL